MDQEATGDDGLRILKGIGSERRIYQVIGDERRPLGIFRPGHDAEESRILAWELEVLQWCARDKRLDGLNTRGEIECIAEGATSAVAADEAYKIVLLNHLSGGSAGDPVATAPGMVLRSAKPFTVVIDSGKWDVAESGLVEEERVARKFWTVKLASISAFVWARAVLERPVVEALQDVKKGALKVYNPFDGDPADGSTSVKVAVLQLDDGS